MSIFYPAVEMLFFREQSLSIQSTTSLGMTSDGCFMPANWKTLEKA
jgi:hypothetical protein